MCGIAGFISKKSGEEDELRIRVRRMSDRLVHRGPDDAGAWVDPKSGVALGFRRLSIVDLSEAGHQPMISACGRYVMVFNGEVYNAPELRPELENLGHRFRGHSDSEVMLASFVQWGIRAAIERFVGMFAFALWDREERALHLVRDRLGIKPLYYGKIRGTLLFGSELKALLAHPDFEAVIDRGALALQMRYGYIPQPFSIYKDIAKVPPGTIVTVRTGADGACSLELQTYWSARQIVESGDANQFNGSEQDAIDQLDQLLRESVRLRMNADVPLGAFLSGGIDSSLVVALMQAQSKRPVKTFTIGFLEAGHNEAIHARKVAAHLGTNHTELYIGPDEALAVIPKLPSLFDEPFADSSQIPTYLVSALARTQVTVSLSGDGGDELFGGYNEYLVARKLWKAVGWTPQRGRSLLSRSVTAVRLPRSRAVTAETRLGALRI